MPSGAIVTQLFSSLYEGLSHLPSRSPNLVADLNEKIIVPGAALTNPNENAIVGPNALIRPLGDEFPAFRLSVALCRGRVQTVYDFSEKSRFSPRFN